jgi:dihydropteroate synthase
VAESRVKNTAQLQQMAEKMVGEGASFIDIGAMSTRPGATEIPVEEEINTIKQALIDLQSRNLDVAISVDTYRTAVAKVAIDYGADFINDIGAGQDLGMLDLVGNTGVGYIAMHKQGMPETMQKNPTYKDVTLEVAQFLLQKESVFNTFGITSWCADPGFGFGKTSIHNYQLLKELKELKQMIQRPILVGVSRKGMIYKNLNITSKEALNGTTALHMAALINGADILRVHDVKEAVQAIALHQLMMK